MHVAESHVFIPMLSYIVEKHLGEKWVDLNVTVEEGIHELSSINCISVFCDEPFLSFSIDWGRKLAEYK
jgi:hypothetical protein